MANLAMNDIKVYKKSDVPVDDPDGGGFSVDVVIMSEDGMLNIGYYDHERKEWVWHTDAMQDLNEVEFKWMCHQFPEKA